MTLRRMGLPAAAALLLLGGAARAADDAPAPSAQEPAARDQAVPRRAPATASGTGSATVYDAPSETAAKPAAARDTAEAQRRDRDDTVTPTLSEDSRSDAFATPSLR